MPDPFRLLEVLVLPTVLVGLVGMVWRRNLFLRAPASLRAIPQAYGEAFQLVLRRPGRERLEHTPVEWSRQGRSQGQPPAALVFLDVFRITLTPLTIALGLEAGGSSYRVHRLEER